MVMLVAGLDRRHRISCLASTLGSRDTSVLLFVPHTPLKSSPTLTP